MTMLAWLLLLGADDAALPARDPVTQTAQALADGAAAEDKGDARALAGAARLLDALGAHPAEGTPDTTGAFRATATARGIPATPPLRGRALGPAYREGVLAAGASLATSQLFLAGQKAVVALVPANGGTLAMRVGEAGAANAICERAVSAPRGGCAWLPLFTRRVEIRITNRHSAPIRYWLVSN